MTERRPRAHRRVQRAGAPGSDPAPQRLGPRVVPMRADDDNARVWGDADDSNDERLKRDVPPHY
jgi:hypothetical protein